MKIRSNLWFENEQHGYFGKGRVKLLQNIDSFGSISKAAKEMKMSYKAAWDAVNEMNTLSKEPIVIRVTGGKGGGGTVLTQKGKEYIDIYNELEMLQNRLFAVLDNKSKSFSDLIDAKNHLTLQTSARNQYQGVIKSIQSSSIEFNVNLNIGGGQIISSSITHKSAKSMNIDINSTIFALIKSSWVHISKEKPKNQLLNIFKGNILSIEDDGKFTEIVIKSKQNNEIVSVVPSKFAQQLSLKDDDELYTSFLPSEVILAI